jgi:hypothetical protein
MAIVDSGKGDMAKGEYTITGFAKFHIDGGNQGAKFLYGHFIAYYPDNPSGVTPGGSASNVVTPPLLSQ